MIFTSFVRRFGGLLFVFLFYINREGFDFDVSIVENLLWFFF